VSSRRGLAVASLLLAVVGGGCASVTVEPVSSLPIATPLVSPTATESVAPATDASGGQSGVPAFSHVYLLVLENEGFASLVGNPNAPFLNSLIAGYGLATNYYGVDHPSEPNYLALFSGSTQGVTDDNDHEFAAANLADQLDAHGKTWAVYAQDYPGNCFLGSSSNGKGEGIGAAGTYARKHNPAMSFTDITGNPVRCAQIKDLAAFDPAATDFAMIVPNECNDMHSCSVAVGDSFLRTFLPRITSSPAFAGSVLFVTTDEGTSDVGGGGRVATVVVGPQVSAGSTSSISYDHYSLLRTIEDAWGLGCLGQSCAATNMAALFG
jgi:phosphatidylinositol-3-phosphatase